MQKFLLGLFLLCYCNVLLAQGTLELTGDAFIQPQSGAVLSTAETRALIVGISTYRELPEDAQLDFAHTDAKNFYTYLLSPAGGNVKPEFVKLLLEEDATASEIYAGLDWLLDKSKPNDKVIIYFAGHGDVEMKTIRQRGFLLAHDSPRAGYHAGGTIKVMDIHDYLETLVSQNKSSVLLITDACRSGKLAGGDAGQAQTTASLQENWSNISKILSAQPGEKSAESSKWGGGYGVFTYHLIDGLKGLADSNNDGFVSLSELNIFLSTEVPKATDSEQNPLVSGSLKVKVSQVNDVELAVLKAKKQLQNQDKSNMIAKRAITANDTTSEKAQKYYRQFRDALNANKLTEPAGKSALYFLKLIESENNQSMSKDLRRALVAAIDKNSQKVINRYMVNDNKLMFSEIEKAAQEMKVAVSLVASSDIRYKSLKARSLFLDNGFLFCICHGQESSREVSDAAMKKLREALVHEPDGAYIYNSMGNVHYTSKNYDSAEYYYLKTALLAPKWSYPVNNLGTLYSTTGNRKKAIQYYEKAIALDPDFAHIYNNLGNFYDDQKKAIEYYQKAMSHDDESSKGFYLTQIGKQYLYSKKKGDWEKAMQYFDQVIEMDSPEALSNLKDVVTDFLSFGLTDEYVKYSDKIIQIFEREISLNRQSKSIDSVLLADLLWDLADHLLERATDYPEEWRTTDAYKACAEASRLQPENVNIMYTLGSIGLSMGDLGELNYYDSARQILEKALAKKPIDKSYFLAELGRSYSGLGNTEQAIALTKEAIPLTDSEISLTYKYNLANYYADVSKYGEALAVIKEILSKGYKADAHDYLIFAEWALENRDFALSESYMTKSISLSKKTKDKPSDTYLILAKLKADQGKRSEAIHILQKLLKDNGEMIQQVMNDTHFKILQTEPRYLELIKLYQKG
jgi:tetratricopeptide (TPR) repeat protein